MVEGTYTHTPNKHRHIRNPYTSAGLTSISLQDGKVDTPPGCPIPSPLSSAEYSKTDKPVILSLDD